jgi:integrase
MATITYLHQTKSEEAQIYCRLSVSRKMIFKRKTNLTCSPEELKAINEASRSLRDAKTKALQETLNQLRSTVFDALNTAQIEGETIDGIWLSKQIDFFFNPEKDKEPSVKSDLLADYFESFIKTLDSRMVRGGKIGVSEATRKKYKSTLVKLEEYETHSGKKVKLSDVNEKFRVAFNIYLKNEKGLAINTIGKYIKIVKTVAIDAQSNGLEVSPLLNKVKGQTQAGRKVYLNFEELEQIKAAKLEDEALETTRDWLVVGCYTGQRVSDLLRMNKNMIESKNGFKFIYIQQTKTGKWVLIPIHKEVQTILDKRKGDFPNSFAESIGSASAMFNRHLKDLCRIAQINKPEEGRLFNPTTKRNESGEFKKWKLITSHVCRRSFASNFYATDLYPTPLLMNITAHGTEKMFLEYIGKKPEDYSLKLAEIWSISTH